MNSHRRSILNQLPRWNVYHRETPILQPSVEHIIPRRLFLHPNHAHDLDNLVSCEKEWNSLRSDYRFGIGRTSLQKSFSWGTLYPHERTFHPSEQADFGLVGRSIITMLHRYPYLYRVLDQIIEPVYLLDEWSNYPCYPYETMRSHLKTISESKF